MDIDRNALAESICQRIDSVRNDIGRQWESSAPVSHFVVDNLLPDAWALQIREAFPHGHEMTLKSSLRERKYVAAQMNRYNALLEESIYAFQLPCVVQRIEQITQLNPLEPDHMLYAGGISLMAPGHFLNPHIDNSHDKHRSRYRVLNLLYYVSPGWPDDHGGNLELWQNGPTGKPTTVASKFNRLVVMVTHERSWHSVSRNETDKDRCCVSNYYFSPNSVDGKNRYHVTSFRGRPEQRIRDTVLRADNWLRHFIRTRFPAAFANPHYYADKQERPPQQQTGKGD
jgi:Rps23 Pro-64 3,4-dihydroxylase Tpa1-like proline 4-hydroxylase